MTKWMTLVVLALGLSACATAYWDRPGATDHELAADSEECWRTALAPNSPSALLRTGTVDPKQQRVSPPPRLWNLTPTEAGFADIEEQLRYEACMTARGYRPTRAARR